MLIANLRRLRHGPLKQLDALWLPLGRTWRWLSQRLGRPIAVKQMVGRYGPFRFDGFFAFSNFSQWGNAHNEGFAACVEACRGKCCALDVGAHIGLVTLPMASVLASGGIVVAFEPSRANRSYLERHVALNGLNGSIRIEGVLVGDAIRDAVPFFEFDEAAGRNTTIAGVLSTNVQRRMVAQVSLDEYCVRAGLSPDVIKIDVEGAEIDVLLGAKRLLAISRPVIFLSVHPRQIQAAGRKLEELTAVISSAGYDCWHMDGSSVSEYGLREYILRPVAVPGSVANEE